MGHLFSGYSAQIKIKASQQDMYTIVYVITQFLFSLLQGGFLLGSGTKSETPRPADGLWSVTGARLATCLLRVAGVVLCAAKTLAGVCRHERSWHEGLLQSFYDKIL